MLLNTQIYLPTVSKVGRNKAAAMLILVWRTANTARFLSSKASGERTADL
jgi:hypothetical protein